MIALLRVELTRLRWRRAVVVLLAAAVLVPVVIFASVAWNTRPISDGEREEVAALVDSETEFAREEIVRCVRNPQRFGRPNPPDPQAYCERILLPRAEFYLSREPLRLGDERTSSGIVLVVVLTLLLLLAGTTFVGHDWNSGSMSNQLLFESRRARIWAAKGLVILLVGLVVAGLVMTAYWSGLIALAQSRDIDLADGQTDRIYGQVLRGAVLAAFAGLGGYALTMLFRSTVATLGILFAVSIAGPLLIVLLSFPGSQRLLPQNNAAAVILGGIRFIDYENDACLEGDSDTRNECVIKISTTGGALYFGGLLLVAGVPSMLSFRLRDVP